MTDMRSILHAIISTFVAVHPHETSSLLHSSSCFFFILSAYFVVLPLRDESAISLGLGNVPGLFIGSLLLTLVAAPLSTFIFSIPSISKPKALFLIHRVFSISMIIFFFLYNISFRGNSKALDHLNKSKVLNDGGGWESSGCLYAPVRIGLFLWVALFNLVTISSTWARVIDVMDSESGSRLFGFIGAGATFGQLFGSLLASGVAWLGPYLLLVAAFFLELAAQSSVGINRDKFFHSEEVPLTENNGVVEQEKSNVPCTPVQESSNLSKPTFWTLLYGLKLILSSSYLLYISLLIWLGAVVSSFFYFQKITIIAMTVSASVDRRMLFAQINSFIAVFILVGQLTLTGRILSVGGVTTALCLSPVVASSSLVALAIWPTWIAIAVSETTRKVVTYVVTRPGRELLFTVVSEDEKYKAKVCIDVMVQRAGDASAAAFYSFLSTFPHSTSISIFALPICFAWFFTAFHLGRTHSHLLNLIN